MQAPAAAKLLKIFALSVRQCGSNEGSVRNRLRRRADSPRMHQRHRTRSSESRLLALVALAKALRVPLGN